MRARLGAALPGGRRLAPLMAAEPDRPPRGPPAARTGGAARAAARLGCVTSGRSRAWAGRQAAAGLWQRTRRASSAGPGATRCRRRCAGEAVRMLDERSVAAGTRRRQTVLLSATLVAGLEGLATLTLHDPVPVGFQTRVEGGRLRIAPGADGGGAGAHAGAPTALAAAARAPEPAATGIPRQLKQRFVEVRRAARPRMSGEVCGLSACS